MYYFLELCFRCYLLRFVVVKFDHASIKCKQIVPVTAATSAVVFVHRLLSTLFNKEVFLSFGIFASYIMQWPLSGPWTGINKTLIICIGFVCYKLTRPSDYECHSKYCLHPAFMKQTGIFSIHKTTSKAHDLSPTTIIWCTSYCCVPIVVTTNSPFWTILYSVYILRYAFQIYLCSFKISIEMHIQWQIVSR